ncbi:maleylacetoacetate isomerase [Neisseria animalis]|uniref:Maleylacetoacetate isomerase n=1 Tax=Neisseria animalis TaxID=492 RepID=A0A5P3MQY3_NEIAN|nr:maleylacetoacetate isomerase [Neisseria animalis]QEY23860.1 maleylacetoacetate isomerase [Neisseria animalis]ROW32074.1 maleylacetoacetate isomerase [Neisseria animalis]VEE05729.1 RegF [Neisseria animalis]
MKLYGFFNSSASYRVRIALNLKGLSAESEGINIRNGLQHSAEYSSINPAGFVPTLEDNGLRLGQSLAIIDYLDRRYPQPQLIPEAAVLRARVLEFSYLIACDLHPLNNLRVLRYLQDESGLDETRKNQWYAHWIADGLGKAEELLRRHDGGEWCFGNAPTLADCCLIPQLANASRMNCDLDAYPLLNAVAAHALKHPAFIQAAPERQSDYVGS